MLVTRISLKNIRSYGDGEEVSVDLPEGVVLLEGDIGSGKSTLLYALEFALFGLSDMKGSHLLTEGKTDGHVSVTIRLGDSSYRVERHLKAKGGDVVQDACFLSDKETRTRMSPTDLKERVVSLLGFNEPTHPHAESLVYRYAVFTPQEKMKDILTQKSDDRLQVIRRVLGAQTYQAAAENSYILERKISKASYGYKRASEDLDDKKKDLSKKSEAFNDLEAELPALKEAADRATRAMKDLESTWSELQDERRRLSEVAGRVPILQREARDLQRESADMDEELTSLRGRLSSILPRVASFRSMKEPGDTLEHLKESHESDRQALAKVEASRDSAASELTKAKDLLSRGVCPVCGQLVPADVSARSTHLQSEISRLDGEASTLKSRFASTSRDLSYAEEWEEARADATRAESEKTDVDGAMESLLTKLESTKSRLQRAKSELEDAEAKAAAARGMSSKIEDTGAQLDLARKADKDATLELSRATAERDELTSRVSELKDEVAKKEAAAAESRRLASHESWVSSFFRPSVEEIEKQTLAHAAASFNGHFQRFFTSLVEDPDMVVRVKEDFSPVFEREGFEQEYDALSGGERTSMALAYRFALNSVIGEDFSSHPELVILDEPTDGFSKEQIYKMRGLLDELSSRQVIIVSHERELESMADHVFRVEKRNGTSSVTKA